MKCIYTFICLFIIINSNAQTFDVYLTESWEDPSFFEIYDDESILITTDNDDTVFSGYLKFESDTEGAVTIKAETGYQVKIIPTKSSSKNNPMGAGTQIGTRPPLGGGGLSKTTLYPNPANNQIQLKSTDNIVAYKIYDSQGTLKSENKLLKSKLFSASLNNLAPGIYYITILLENGQTTSKQFIKQ